MEGYRIETDGMGEIRVPEDKLWGAQTQRALHHFAIGEERLSPEMIRAYAILKRAAADANRDSGRLPAEIYTFVAAACDALIEGGHADMFPLSVWISGSGTQFNMNVNEVVANLASRLAGEPLASKRPAHPNDHVNLCQSTNDSFPSAMHIAAALAVTERLLPALKRLRHAIDAKAHEWKGVVKIGRTHLQDATPLTLGQEWSGYVAMLDENWERLESALPGVYRLALGGTAVGTGLNAVPGFAEAAIAGIASRTGLPFVPAPNKFAAQGAHDALVHLSGVLRTTAVSLRKIADDIRFVACGPRSGIGELILPENEPGSSIMPGKVNPTQCEAMTMLTAQVIANDVAVTLGGAGGHLEMNAYKPLIIRNILQSVRLLADGSDSFRVHLVEGVKPDLKNIGAHLGRSLMLVTALTPLIGYDKAADIAHHAAAEDLTLREAALASGHISAEDFDRLADPLTMT